MTLQLRNIPGKLVQAGKDAVITITEQVFNLRYCVRGTSNMKKSSITSLVIFRWRLMESSCEVLLWGFPTLTPPDPSRRELLQQVHQCSLPGKIAGFPLHRAQDSLVQLICIYVFDHLIYTLLKMGGFVKFYYEALQHCGQPDPSHRELLQAMPPVQSTSIAA